MKNNGKEITLEQREEVLFEKRGNLAIISLNRPEKLNCLTRKLTSKLREIAGNCERDESISILLLKGVGDRAFSAGGDLVAIKEIVENINMFLYYFFIINGSCCNRNKIFRIIIKTFKINLSFFQFSFHLFAGFIYLFI